MIKVYAEIEGSKYAQLIADFQDEDLYIKCLPALEEWAKENGFDNITESAEYDEEG